MRKISLTGRNKCPSRATISCGGNKLLIWVLGTKPGASRMVVSTPRSGPPLYWARMYSWKILLPLALSHEIRYGGVE